MKINQVLSFYQAAETMFRCPICFKEIMTKEPADMLCASGHCFNMSKYGYINFSPNQKQTKYNEELFESRRLVFDNGYYKPLAEKISQLVKKYMIEKETYSILDVGCGEGYYDWYLKEECKGAEIYAVDNVRDAIKMGAKRCKDVRWLVGNLANVPIKTNSIDLVLEIFAPSNYSEFQRVLGKDGVLIKVIPNKNYLKELRELIGKTTEDTEDSVKDYFCKSMNLMEEINLTYTKPICPELREHFLKMTPMMFGRDDSEIDVSKLEQMTFDFVILVGGICESIS